MSPAGCLACHLRVPQADVFRSQSPVLPPAPVDSAGKPRILPRGPLPGPPSGSARPWAAHGEAPGPGEKEAVVAGARRWKLISVKSPNTDPALPGHGGRAGFLPSAAHMRGGRSARTASRSVCFCVKPLSPCVLLTPPSRVARVSPSGTHSVCTQDTARPRARLRPLAETTGKHTWTNTAPRRPWPGLRPLRPGPLCAQGDRGGTA